LGGVASQEYTPRLVDRRLDRLLEELPAVLLTGPRATGKTTTAARHVSTIVRLDRPAEAAAFRADPDAALRVQAGPVLLDEWEAVPEVLGAVKRAVDDDPRPGRFLLTGSARGDLEAETWPGTGRLVRLAMFGLTERELLHGTGEPTFVDRLARGRLDEFTVPSDPPDLADYVALALRGGYPEPALRLSREAGQAWLDGYIDQLLTRDATAAAGPRDPARLRRYFQALALMTAGVPEHKTIYDAAGINRRTALAYDRLLTGLFVLDAVPAWVSNRLSRLVATPKRYLVDPSLAAAALGLDTVGLMRDGDLMGRLIETFVVAQIRPELELLRPKPFVHHLREKDGRREIDLIVELATGDLVAIEIKATSAPSAAHAQHLAWLRDVIGERFKAGAVLHTGPHAFSLGERVLALPICTLWSDLTRIHRPARFVGASALDRLSALPTDPNWDPDASDLRADEPEDRCVS
jgi:predicted AAA+ superfamily ATPase